MRTITDHLSTIDGVSDQLAANIAGAFDSYADLAAASVDDLRAVKGVGPVLAARIQAAAIEASPAAATKARADEAGAAARTTAQKASGSGKKAASSVASRADKSATAAKAAADRAKSRADSAVASATDTAADATDAAASATAKADRDFAASVERRHFGPITLPADLPWPIGFALDTTEAVVGVGLKVTTGVLETVGRKLR